MDPPKRTARSIMAESFKKNHEVRRLREKGASDAAIKWWNSTGD